MPVPTLFELARQRLIRNIDLLNDIGDIPFSFLEPVLRFVQNPEQLEELERNCPQILGETGDIWLRMIKRDIPDWDKKSHQPRDPKKWNRVYRMLKKEMEREKQEQENALKQQMKALQQDRAQNKTLIVDSKVGYGARSSRMFSFGGGSSRWGASNAPTKTGKAAYDNLRKGMYDWNRERPMAAKIPSHELAARKAKVKAAPASMVRMAESQVPRNMVISRQAAASVAHRKDPLPAPKQSNITHRPVPQQPSRTSLPNGRQFNTPKLKAPNGGAAPLKRQRDQPSGLFHKKRKL